MKPNFSPTLLTLCIASLFSYSASAQSFDCRLDGETPRFTSIQTIQGSGDSSPFINGYPYLTDEDHYVQGVVTAVTQSLTKGFYLQAIENDDNDSTSEGLFVYTGAEEHGVKAGDLVCARGKIQEYYNNTQLKSDQNSYVKLSESSEVSATPFVVKEGENLRQALERHEGMQIKLNADSALFVTRNFSFDYDARRNNLMLSYQAPLFKPTQLFAANSPEAKNLATANANNRLYLESDIKAPNGEIPYYPDFAKDIDQNGSSEHHIRLGSRLEGLTGVFSYSYGEYRLIATNNISNNNFVTQGTDFDVARKDKPSLERANLQVASFNVLNYFTSFAASGNANPLEQNRGAESLEEFSLQKAKIISAIQAMDADIIGLMEIENNGFDDNSAIADLVTGLNENTQDSSKHYRYVAIEESDKYQGKYFGSDAIMVAILYRPTKVTPTNAAQIIITPEQHVAENTVYREKEDGSTEGNPAYDQYQRHSLLQSFTLAENGEKLAVVVNHFKSKGSECIEEWLAGVEDEEPADLQGNCNNFRVSAAKTLGDALMDVQGDILILGDLNAYAMEDPLLTLTDYSAQNNSYGREIFTAAFTNINGGEIQVESNKIEQGYGYINLNKHLSENNGFSYTYSGELGSLDHVLANSSLARKVVAIEDWHINSLESDLFEYSGKFTADMPKYKDMFSSSDHDPILLSIEIPNNKISLPNLGARLKVSVRLPLDAIVGDKLSLSLLNNKKDEKEEDEADYTANTLITEAHLQQRSAELTLDKIPQAGSYSMEEKLTDSTGEVIKFSATRQIQLQAEPLIIERKGGSTGLGFLLMLMGVFAWRYKKQSQA